MQDFSTPRIDVQLALRPFTSPATAFRTRLLIYTELRNPRAGTPGSYFSYLIHQNRQGIVLGAQVQYHAEMLGKPFETPNILADQLGGAVVVVDDGEDTIDDGMVGLKQAYEDPEDDMREGVCEMMHLRLDKGADGCLASLLAALVGGRGGSRSCRAGELRRIGQIWPQQVLALGGTEFITA